jgi:hypothetical protein
MHSKTFPKKTKLGITFLDRIRLSPLLGQESVGGSTLRIMLLLSVVYKKRESETATKAHHRNLKTSSRIQPWKVKKIAGKNSPKQNLYRIPLHGRFGSEFSIRDTKWGAHTLGTFSQLVFTFRVLVFRFLRGRHGTS